MKKKFIFLIAVILFIVAFVMSSCSKTEAQYGATLEYLKSKCTGTEKIYDCGDFFCRDTSSSPCVVAYSQCLGSTVSEKVIYTCGDSSSEVCVSDCDYAGQLGCYSATSMKICSRQTSSCLKWVPSTCPSGETCQNNDCVPSESTITCYQCSGTSVISQSFTGSCGSGWSVSQPSCNSPVPTNECEYGQSKCIGNDLYKCTYNSVPSDMTLVWKIDFNCKTQYGQNYYCDSGICKQSETTTEPEPTTEEPNFFSTYGVILSIALILIAVTIYLIFYRKKGKK